MGKAAAIYAIVDGGVDFIVELVDLGAQGVGVEVWASGDRLKFAVEQLNDVGALVVDDGLAVAVPENRDGSTSCIAGVAAAVKVRQAAAIWEREIGLV